MTTRELDAELLSRLAPSELKGLSDLNASAWFGYRFAHPMLRVYHFADEYKKHYTRTGKMIGNLKGRPGFMFQNPFTYARKPQIFSIIRAAFTADSFGIPYDLYLQVMMDEHLRMEVTKPLQPNQLYNKFYIGKVLDAWKERNEAGIYLAKAPQFNVDNYVGHPIQDAYKAHLCDLVQFKGNRPYYLARLIYDVRHLTEEDAVGRFGTDILDLIQNHR